MNLADYIRQLDESLYFGPWNECNPGKAMLLLQMAEMELDKTELADMYCRYVFDCFDSSVKYGDQDRNYYEKALRIFQKLVVLLDKEETPDLFNRISEKVEAIISLASKAIGWASGYDEALQEAWCSCKWFYEIENE